MDYQHPVLTLVNYRFAVLRQGNLRFPVIIGNLESIFCLIQFVAFCCGKFLRIVPSFRKLEGCIHCLTVRIYPEHTYQRIRLHYCFFVFFPFFGFCCIEVILRIYTEFYFFILFG